MSTRDSDTDLGKVFPDVETMQREADPSRRRAKLEQALDTPPVVDAALTLLRHGLKEGEDPLYYEVPRHEARPEQDATPSGGDGDAAPSPWSKEVGEALPREMLPSAAAPIPVSPEGEEPHSGDAAQGRGPQRPRWISVRSAALAVAAVFVPLAVMWALFVRPEGSKDGAAHAARAVASTAIAPPTPPPAPTPTEAAVTPPPSSAAPPPSNSAAPPDADAGPEHAPPVQHVKQRPGAKRPPTKPGSPPEEDNPEIFQ